MLSRHIRVRLGRSLITEKCGQFGFGLAFLISTYRIEGITIRFKPFTKIDFFFIGDLFGVVFPALFRDITIKIQAHPAYVNMDRTLRAFVTP